MVPICSCELSFFDYVIRIGNLSVLVYFLIYFVENKFLLWLRKDDDWVVIDRQMLDTMFDNNEKSTEELPELEQEEVSEEAASEQKEKEAEAEVEAEAEAEAADEAVDEAENEAEAVDEADAEATDEAEAADEEQEKEASKILDETEIVDLLMK